MNKKYVIGLKIIGEEELPCAAYFTYVGENKESNWEYSKNDPKIKIFDDVKSAMVTIDKIYDYEKDLKDRGRLLVELYNPVIKSTVLSYTLENNEEYILR